MLGGHDMRTGKWQKEKKTFALPCLTSPPPPPEYLEIIFFAGRKAVHTRVARL